MNSDNPYAAPKAIVADVDPVLPLDRPPRADQAIKYLWIGLLIGIASSIINLFTFEQPGLSRSAQIGVTMVSLVVGLGIWAWLISRAGRGRNWARIVILIFVIFGLLSSVSMFTSPVKIHWSVWTLYVVQTGLNVTAVTYLFTSPANEWYLALKRSAVSP